MSEMIGDFGYMEALLKYQTVVMSLQVPDEDIMRLNEAFNKVIDTMSEKIKNEVAGV